MGPEITSRGFNCEKLNWLVAFNLVKEMVANLKKHNFIKFKSFFLQKYIHMAQNN